MKKVYEMPEIQISLISYKEILMASAEWPEGDWPEGDWGDEGGWN